MRRRRSDSGAVAVEAALVTPVLILLVFGGIEFGLAFKDWLAVSSAVRAGARVASAEPRVPTYAQDAANQVANEAIALDPTGIKDLWIYRAQTKAAGDAHPGYPKGDNGSFSSCSLACVKFHWDNTAKRFVQDSSSWLNTAQNACLGDAQHDAVGVYLHIQRTAITHLFFDQLDIGDYAAFNLEPISATLACK